MARVAVVGTGAMGSVYAALLAHAGHEVVAIDVDRDHVDAMDRHGLRLHGASGDRTVQLTATPDAETVGPCDLVVVATKSYSLPKAAQSVVPLLGDETLVLTIQNGLGNLEALSGALSAAGAPTGNVLVGVAFGFGATLEKPGVAVHRGMGTIRLGEADGRLTPRLESLSGLWRDAGFNVSAYEDIHQLIWEKFVCNVTVNGPCSVFGHKIGELLAHEEARPVAIGCGLEAHAVGRALGIDFSFDDPEAFIDAWAETVGDHYPSTAQDFFAGRPTEIDAINGRVPSLAKEAGLSAPYNEVVTAVVRSGRRS